MGMITLQQMKKKWNDNAEDDRRFRVSELLTIYDSDWRVILERELAKLFLPQNYDKLKMRADTSLNLLRWATDTIAAIYSKPVQRELDGDPEPWNRFRDLDLAMDSACKLLFLCKELFIRPLVYSDGSVLLDVLTPDKVLVIPSKTDPWTMDAIAYSVENGDRFIVWTDENHFILDDTWQVINQPDNPENLNPYGVIPWLALHQSYPIEGSFFNDLKSEGLKQATLSAAIAMTEHAHLRQLQSFKQLAFLGMGSDESALRAMVDPSSAISIKNPNASIQVLDMQADLQKHLQTILDSAASTLNLYGIRPDMVKGTMTAPSGYALSIMMHDLSRQWEAQRQIWRVYETALYNLTSRVLQVDIGETLPEGEIRIIWGDIQPAANPQEEANYYQTLVTNQLISKKTAMMRMLGLTEEEVQEEFEQMAMEQKQFSLLNIPVMGSAPEIDDFSAGESMLDSLNEKEGQIDLPKEKAADTALNGAQVGAAMSIVERVATGALPRQTGVEMLVSFFQLTKEQAEEIMGSVGLTFRIGPVEKQ